MWNDEDTLSVLINETNAWCSEGDFPFLVLRGTSVLNMLEFSGAKDRKTVALLVRISGKQRASAFYLTGREEARALADFFTYVADKFLED